MIAFLDFEASSLGKHGFPIEVAWVFEDGRSESYLILPAEGWTDWDDKAEAIHAIDRATLLREGQAVEDVAKHLVEGLDEHDIFASAPSWDGKWLSLLLRAAGLPRHTLRLRDSEQAREQAVREVLEPAYSGEDSELAVEFILTQVEKFSRSQPVRHRALPDAEHERQVWLEASLIARQFLAEPRETQSFSASGRAGCTD